MKTSSSRARPRDLNEIRADLEAAKTELDELRSAPLRRDEAIAAIGLWIDSQAARFAPRLAARQFLNPGGSASINIFQADAIGPGLRSTVDLAPMIAWLLGDVAKQRLADALPDDGRDWPPAAERPALMASLERKIDRLEIEEELAARVLEERGEQAERRPDARPELVLCPDEELTQ